jgi:hypothetical protein
MYSHRYILHDAILEVMSDKYFIVTLRNQLPAFFLWTSFLGTNLFQYVRVGTERVVQYKLLSINTTAGSNTIK